MRVLMAAMLCTAFLAGCASVEDTSGYEPDPFVDRNGDDAVVIAVVDSGINPYHFDYAARFMPQHLNGNASDDLPLDTDPSTWLPGYPEVSEFASFAALDLDLSDDPDASGADLHDADEEAWATMKSSSGEDDAGVHLRWIPGTKIVGFVNFGGGDGFGAGTHGGGSASVSTGNFHGTCPECLLVFVNGLSSTANDWVAKQDWIDAQTNSWGGSSSGVVRDRIYTDCDLDDQLTGVTRGQQIFFSAGNGVNNDFITPNPTLFSCQEGPDWIVTVGAIHPADGSSYSGHGKPADVAAPGGSYPSAYCSASINCTGSFGGTSSATPTTTGMYGKALYEVRRMMEGPSRMQSEGTIATGATACVAAGCAIEDGNLTVHELRAALYAGSAWTDTSWSTAGNAYPASTEEMTYMAEGHGSFWGRLRGDEQYAAEWQAVVGALTGAHERAYPGDASAWFQSLSYCTQMGWGEWEHGDYQGSLPDAAPDRPMTRWLQTACPATIDVVLQVQELR